MTKCGFTNIISQKFYAFSGIFSQNFLSILLRMTFLNVPFLIFLLFFYSLESMNGFFVWLLAFFSD